MKEDIKSSLSPFLFIDHYVSQLTVKNALLYLDTDGVERILENVECTPEVTTEDEEHFAGKVELTVKARAKRGKRSMIISLTLVGFFSGERSDMTHDDFCNYLEASGVATLYSIARGIVINISAQCAPQGHLRLPTLNVVKLNRARKEQAQNNSEQE